jgi:hypothetical protein
MRYIAPEGSQSTREGRFTGTSLAVEPSDELPALHHLRGNMRVTRFQVALDLAKNADLNSDTMIPDLSQVVLLARLQCATGALDAVVHEFEA